MIVLAIDSNEVSMNWKPVKADKRYEVSSCGQVRKSINARHPERGKPFIILKQEVDKDGYRKVEINRKRTSVHRIVYESHVGPLVDGLVVSHLNGKRSDNRTENLFQCTQKENVHHKLGHGTWQSSERHPRASLTNDLVKRIKDDLSNYQRGRVRILSERYEVPIYTIYYIKSGGYADA